MVKRWSDSLFSIWVEMAEFDRLQHERDDEVHLLDDPRYSSSLSVLVGEIIDTREQLKAIFNVSDETLDSLVSTEVVPELLVRGLRKYSPKASSR